MNTWIDTGTLNELTMEQLKLLHPNTSFPQQSTWPGGVVGDITYALVHLTPEPSYNYLIEEAVEAPAAEIDGVWWRQWEVVPLPAPRARNNLFQAIDSQVVEISATQRAIDPLSEADVIRSASAASDKHMELEGTSDENLAVFDPTLMILPPGADAEYVRFAVSITKQTPWAGQPDAIYGFQAVIQPEGADIESGSEARLYVVSAPADTGAVLPFTRITSPSGDYWECLSRDGFKWDEPLYSVSVQLLWGAGSLPVSPVLSVPEAYERQACAVRYGTAVPTRR